jgi:hypothetical protein
MRRAALILSLSATLLGCGSDFNVAGLKDPNEAGDDTGEPLADDDGGDDSDPEDEDPVEDEGNVGDDPPDEEEPVDEDDEPEDDEPGDDDPAPEDDCEETSDLIYVIDRDNETLSLFDPDTLALTELGTLDCSWLDGTPASMGITRDGYAYVRYSSNTVFEVDLTTLDCTEASYSNGSTGFGSFGMGFATNSADTWRDQLYVANRTHVARLDTSSWQVTTLGTLPSQAELTGTADGELWAFLPLESPAALVELDKSSGAELSRTRLSSFPNPGDIDTFAFAAWGGSHFLFVRTYGMGQSSDVYEVDSTGRMTQVVDGLGLNVVGAGVSTCAPTE